jgi:hypothetical protein
MFGGVGRNCCDAAQLVGSAGGFDDHIRPIMKVSTELLGILCTVRTAEPIGPHQRGKHGRG